LRVIVLEVSSGPPLSALPSSFFLSDFASPSFPPPGMPIATGVAAPRLVAGAIAATWLA